MRELSRGGLLSEAEAARCLADVIGLPAQRHRAEPMLMRAWELRHNLTIYDALYVTLAESLEAPLVTVDAKFDTPVVRRLIAVEVVR